MEILTNKSLEDCYTPVEIEKIYKEEKINYNERYLLYALRKKTFLESYLEGDGEYKMYYDRSIPTELYFTNVEAVLNSFYTLYEKCPNYHLDKVLENELKEMSTEPGCVYYVLTYLEEQLKNEKEKKSPFIIEKKEALDNIKKELYNYRDFHSHIQRYRGINKENGVVDIYKEYNETFKDMMDFDMFDEEEKTVNDENSFHIKGEKDNE